MRTPLLLCILLTALFVHAQQPADARLFEAIAAEDTSALSRALQQGASLSSHNEYGYTPLTAAAMQGNEHLVEALLAAGAQVDAADNNGSTALIVASQQNQIDDVEVLLSHHAAIDAADRTGRSAIFYAVRRDHEMLQLLLGAHPNLGIVDHDSYTVLGEAYRLNDYELVQILAHAGARLASPQEELFAASATGDVAQINRLLTHGAKVNDFPAGATTPLMIAAWRGNTAAVRVLLAHGADPNVFDRNKQNGLFWAFSSKHLSTVEAVLDASPDLKLPLNGDRSALHLAARYLDEPKLINRLLAEGVPVDGLDFLGDTPLMDAAQNGHRHAAEALIKAHADPTLRDKKGLNAAEMAAQHGDHGLAVWLGSRQ